MSSSVITDVITGLLPQVNHTWPLSRRSTARGREIRSTRCWDWSRWRTSSRRSSNQKSWTSPTSTVSGACFLCSFKLMHTRGVRYISSAIIVALTMCNWTLSTIQTTPARVHAHMTSSVLNRARAHFTAWFSLLKYIKNSR